MILALVQTLEMVPAILGKYSLGLPFITRLGLKYTYLTKTIKQRYNSINVHLVRNVATKVVQVPAHVLTDLEFAAHVSNNYRFMMLKRKV